MNNPQKRLWFIILILLCSLFTVTHALTFFRPLIGHHDFLNGHVLTTVAIWRKEGILKHIFVPVYTFTSDLSTRTNFGVMGKNERMYYISYPPLIFYIAYIISFIPGVGITPFIPKIASLLTFLVSLFLFYYYLREKYNRLVALFGMSVFSLFPVSLYFLGNVFFVDMAIIPIWFLAFIIYQKLLHKPQKKYTFLFLGLLFLLCITEWMGYLLAAVLWISNLLRLKHIHIIHQQHRTFLYGVFIIPLTALAFLFILYAQIIDIKMLENGLMGKLLFRSSASVITSFSNPAQKMNYVWELIQRQIYHFNLSFGRYFIVLLILSFCTIVTGLWRGKKIPDKREFLLVFIFFFIPSFLHFIILSQFHYDHDFGFLYFLFFITFICIWGFIDGIELISPIFQMHANLLTGLVATIYIFILVAMGLPIYNIYLRRWIWYPAYYTNLYENMRKNTKEHDLIITNHESQPMNWFYLQRNVLGRMVGADVVSFKNTNSNIQNVYYMTDVYENARVSCGEKEISYRDILFICKLQ